MNRVITDPSERNRLTLHFVPEGEGANFHWLTWLVRDGSTWRERAVITRETFQPATKHRRWISRLHSFDPVTGRAVIQVAEGDKPAGTLPVHYTYSWREWDIEHNREVRLLGICDDVFKDYDPNA